MRLNMDATNKTALVLGGCRGIGKAIALRLAADGFDIAATCRKKGPDSESLEKEIAAAGRQCTILELDVCDRDGARKVLTDAFGENAPDAVIYNSGITRDNLQRRQDSRLTIEVQGPE